MMDRVLHKNMKISIVIPTKDREGDLCACLGSILRQTKTPLEVILIDDGNVPHGLVSGIQKAFQEKEIPFIYQKKEKPGLAESKNLGAKIACGDVVVFLDDDVVLGGDYIEKLEQIWNACAADTNIAGVAGVASDSRKIGALENAWNRVFLASDEESGWKILPWGYQTWSEGVLEKEEAMWIPGYNSSFRKSIFERYQFCAMQDGRTALEDIELCWNLSKKGFKFVMAPELRLEHHQSVLGREKGYRSGCKEGYNRCVIYGWHAEKTLGNKLRFMWASIGWILRHAVAIGLEPKRIGYHGGYGAGLCAGFVTYAVKGKRKDKECVLQHKEKNQKGMRILYVITKAVRGGAQNYVLDLAKSADERGYEVTVAAGGEGWLLEEARKAGMRTKIFSHLRRTWNPLRMLMLLMEFRRYSDAEKFDVIHLNSSNTFFCAASVNRRDVEVIATIHGWSILSAGWRKGAVLKAIFRACMKYLLQKMDACIYVCAADQKIGHEVGIFPKYGDRVVYLGSKPLEVLERKEARELLERHMSKKVTGKIIGTIARLDYPKNLDLLIEAGQIMKQDHCVFVILGYGPLKKRLLEKAAALQLTEKVYVFDSIEQAVTAINGFDLFVLTSLYEGLPYTVIEAGQMGLPVVATAVGGVPEIIKNNETGILVDTMDAPALAEGIRRLLRSTEERERFGKSLQGLVKDVFTLDRMARETFALYEEVRGGQNKT